MILNPLFLGIGPQSLAHKDISPPGWLIFSIENIDRVFIYLNLFVLLLIQ
jgi:hypothetical protein